MMEQILGDTHRPIAIIDMGSNSIRLVIYDHKCRAPLVLCNEKASCQLALGISKDGCLGEAEMQAAFRCLARFSSIIRERGIDLSDVHMLATSAVRDACNQTEFLLQARQYLPCEVKILSGEEEARLSALGVLANHRNARGLVGDLGGGSTELIVVHSDGNTPWGNRRLGKRISLPLGTIRTKAGQDTTIVDADIDRLLPDWSHFRDQYFYAVGGSWRNLGKLHIQYRQYPLSIIADYRVERAEMLSFIDIILSKPNFVQQLGKISERRAAMLPFSARLLQRILLCYGLSGVIFSASGVRDGYFLTQLSSVEQKQDGLEIAALRAFPHLERKAYAELHRFIAPVFDTIGKPQQDLGMMLCLLADIAKTDHPDYRAEHALSRVLHLHAPQLSHQDRAWLSVSVASRYGKLPTESKNLDVARSLLSEDDYMRAIIAGGAVRIAYSLSGGALGLLRQCELELYDGSLKLHVPEHLRYLLNEKVERHRVYREKALGKFCSRFVKPS